MACYHPSKVRVRRKLAGERERLDDQMVGCGNCLGCRSDQAREWAIRLNHESRYHDDAWFITLTYDDDHLPTHGSLAPEDLQGFFKRLRRHYSGRRLSYYACGEYGDQSQRPHYHAVLCGAPLLDRDRLPDRDGRPVWHSELLDAKWGLGLVDVATVSPGACAYVAGYVNKKIRHRHADKRYTRVIPETGELVELVPEFSRMSRRPAIARGWIEKYWRDVYPRDFVVQEGREYNPPRYYDRFMDLPDDKGGSHERRTLMEEVRFQRWKDRTELADEKLIMKEKIHRARNRLFNRRNDV